MGDTENSAYAQDFDPNADPTERRRIRFEYRNLITEIRGQLTIVLNFSL